MVRSPSKTRASEMTKPHFERPEASLHLVHDLGTKASARHKTRAGMTPNLPASKSILEPQKGLSFLRSNILQWRSLKPPCYGSFLMPGASTTRSKTSLISRLTPVQGLCKPVRPYNPGDSGGDSGSIGPPDFHPCFSGNPFLLRGVEIEFGICCLFFVFVLASKKLSWQPHFIRS